MNKGLLQLVSFFHNLMQKSEINIYLCFLLKWWLPKFQVYLLKMESWWLSIWESRSSP